MNSRPGRKISQRPPACLSTWQDRALVYVLPWAETSGHPSSPYSHNNASHAAVTSLFGGIGAISKDAALYWFRLAADQLGAAIRELNQPRAKIVPGPRLAGHCPMGDKRDKAYFESVREMYPVIGAKFGPVGYADSAFHPPGVESFDWHYSSDELPDDQTTCLIATDFDGSDEIEIAYCMGDVWLYPSGEAVTIPVYAWAYAPAKPAKKGGR